MAEVAARYFPKLPAYASPEAVVEELKPDYPVYCFRPHVIRRAARTFVQHFPGDTLYAIKCNPAPHILKELHEAGIRHYDTASLHEIGFVSAVLSESTCYFMHPVKSRAAIREAHFTHGVRHHVVDHSAELRKIAEVIPPDRQVVILIRLTVNHPGVFYELSSKFGASIENALDLLSEVEALGYSAGVCFHVGSQCHDMSAYQMGLDLVNRVLRRTHVKLRCVDVGGGFPGQYLDFPVAELRQYIDTIAAASRELDLPEGCRLLCEPGRGISAAAESLIVQIQLRKEDAIYLNDGTYGSLDEAIHGLKRPTRMVTSRKFAESTQHFTAYGPTCDSLDVLPNGLELPCDVQEGDWIEFGQMGAYGSACRTSFNGFYPDTFVVVDNDFTTRK